jgi:predicted DNA-binding transcriptional regulator AlpA
MTARKADIPLTFRLTAYVTREQGAAELQVSPSTWDDMVACGQLPKPRRLGRMGSILRWRWTDVDNRLRGDDAYHADPEPFFREQAHGTTKDRKREAA